MIKSGSFYTNPVKLLKFFNGLQKIKERHTFATNIFVFIFNQKKYSHGDIQPKLICNSRGDWKLLDNYFIKGGVSAYEKVLEGE